MDIFIPTNGLSHFERGIDGAKAEMPSIAFMEHHGIFLSLSISKCMDWVLIKRVII